MMISEIAEMIVYGFAVVGFLIVLCLALGATLVATDSEIKDRRRQAKMDAMKAAFELEAALHHARQPEHILVPAMTEGD